VAGCCGSADAADAARRVAGSVSAATDAEGFAILKCYRVFRISVCFMSPSRSSGAKYGALGFGGFLCRSTTGEEATMEKYGHINDC
jgi:hypothetical protein